MFCGKCGQEIEKGIAFCPSCGAPQGEPKVENEAVTPAEPVAEDVEVVAENVESVAENAELTSEPVIEDTEVVNEPIVESAETVSEPASEPVIEQEIVAPKNKKGNKALKISLLVAIPALIVALAIVLDVFSILGFITKTFGSDSAYFCYAEKKALQSESDPVFDLYEDVLDFLEEPEFAGETEVKLNIGESAQTLINSYGEMLGGSIDLSSLKDAGIKFNSNFKDGKLELEASTKFIDSPIKFVVDPSANKVYLNSSKASNDLYLEFPAQVNKFIPGATNIDYSEYLPSKNEFRLLLKKYSDIIFENIDDIVKIGDSVTVGGITQSCSVLQLDIDEKLIANCLLAIIEECRKDDDIKDILTDLQALSSQLGMNPQTNFYNSLLSSLNEGQAEIQSKLASLAGTDGEKFLTIVSYVANNGEIIGREFYQYQDEAKVLMSSSLRAEDGDKLAIQVKSGSDEQEVSFEAQGTGDFDEKFSLNGSYVYGKDKLEILKVEGKDIVNDGDASGSVKISLGKDLIALIPEETSAIVSLLNPVIEFKFDCTDEKADISINLLKDNELLVGIGITSTEKDAEDVVFQPKNEVDGNNSENISKWMEDIGIDLSAISNLLASNSVAGAVEENYSSDYDDNDYDYSEDEVDYDYDYSEDEVDYDYDFSDYLDEEDYDLSSY